MGYEKMMTKKREKKKKRNKCHAHVHMRKNKRKDGLVESMQTKEKKK
jgi:hypothetical protein